MPATRIILPKEFIFSCVIPVRITDINYGGHAGNDSILSLLHEARMQYMKSMGYTELNFEGLGMIMADVCIEFKKELFYGDHINASVTPGELTKIGFDLFYKLETIREHAQERSGPAVIARSHMICYDYEKKKIVPVPVEALKKLNAIL